MTRKGILFLSLSLVFAFCLTACSQKESKVSDKPLVYTSFYPVQDLVEQVVGDTVEVKSFMPLEKEPHMWEPTAKDIKELSKADLLVVNGANLESWIDKVSENLPDLRILKLSDSIELISYKGAAVIGDFQYMCEQEAKRGQEYEIHFGHTHEDLMRVSFINNSKNLSKEELIKKGKKQMNQKGQVVPQQGKINVEDGKVYAIEMGHEQGAVYYIFPKEGNWVFLSDRISEPLLPYNLQKKNTDEDLDVNVLLAGSTSNLDKITYDPHSWLSLTNAKMYLNSIQDTLSEMYPDKARFYNRNKVKAVDKLTDLEVEYKEKFKNLEKKEFIVTHYAYEYLAREFGLVQYPLQGLVSTESPSLKTIKKAIGFSRAKDLDTIFYEYGNDPKSAKALAEEVGGQAVGLTSMEYKTDQMKGGLTYQDIMRENLEKIYKSLGGEVDDEAG